MDTNASRLLIYFPFFIITLLLLVNAARKRKQAYSLRQYFYSCLNLAGWITLEMLYYILKKPAALYWVFQLKLVFVAFFAVTIFFAIAGYFRLNLQFPKRFHLMLCIVPGITTLLVVFSPLHPFVLKNFDIVALSPLTVAANEPGLWYFVHTAYSQLLAVGILCVLVKCYHTLPQAHRGGSGLMFLGILSYGLLSLKGGLGLDRNTLDYNLLGGCIGACYYYLASLARHRPSYLHIETQDVFHYLDEAVLILDSDSQIIDINRTAQNLLAQLGQQQSSARFDELLNRLTAQGKIVRKKHRGQPYEDIYIQNGRFPLVFEMQTQFFRNAETGDSAQLVMLTDVTNNRLVIDRLTETAGYDALTGLVNRYGYLEMLREHDAEEFLPLSIVMGDVNNLKTINDNYGHAKGDELLQKAAGILSECCPSDGHAARIGGDEFILLLPKCPRDSAMEVIATIRERLLYVQVADYNPSIALGCATKTHPGQNIKLLIADADKAMYADKNEICPLPAHT